MLEEVEFGRRETTPDSGQSRIEYSVAGANGVVSSPNQGSFRPKRFKP